MSMLLGKIEETSLVESLDEETIRMTERMVVVRTSTRHINILLRLLEMRRNEMCELARLMGFEEVRREVETERSLESWTKRASNHFTKKDEENAV